MCKKLNVSRSGYYKWLNRKESTIEIENKQLAAWITEYDTKYKHILGYRRMRNWINRDKGTSFSKRRVQRIMNLLGIKSSIRKKRKPYRRSTQRATAENVLHREFLATKPNEKWATDVTEFKIPMSNKKLYLSAIIDLYDRSIVAYKLSNRNDNELVFDTLDLAISSNPGAAPLFHSDRGYQYTSRAFQQKLLDNGIEQSMSRVRCCIDNGPTEGLWGIIKSEMYYNTNFKSEDELREAIKDYIFFYNNSRYQERFNNLTPTEVRQAAMVSIPPAQYPIPENKRILAYKAMLLEKREKSNRKCDPN
jgi:transposase InsO family protein